MAILNITYLEHDDLAAARATSKRTDVTAADNIRNAAFDMLRDLPDVSIVPAGEPGTLALESDDARLGQVQQAVGKRIRHLVPRGHISTVLHTPRFAEGGGI